MELFYYAASVMLLGIIVLFFIKRRSRGFSRSDLKFFAETWRRVEDTEPRQALLEADKLLDHALRKLGYEGSLGDKLKKAGSLFSDKNGVWHAHKMRNRLAHEIEFRATDHEMKRALQMFKRSLQDLGILL